MNSTRLVALTSDNGSKRKITTNVASSLPIQQAPTLIKIEDSATTTSHCNPLISFEPKSSAIQTATITTAVQPNGMPPEIAAHLSSYYQTHGLHGNLIQIAPHTTALNTTPAVTCHTTNAAIQMPPLINTIECRSIQTQPMPPIQSPPDVTVSTMSCMTPITETYSHSKENLDSSGVSTLPEGALLIRAVYYIYLPRLACICVQCVPSKISIISLICLCFPRFCSIPPIFSARCKLSNRHPCGE